MRYLFILNLAAGISISAAIHAQELKPVTVTGKKKMVEQKIDRTIIHVDAMITAAGSNALEVLAKSPGVMVDMNSDIRLNGKNGVLVLIDGRPTYLSSQDLAEYLRSLPAETLDRIELISNPPARYEASGGAIINIILKKNRNAGFQGNISAGYSQGMYGRSNTALNINYRQKKWNVFANGSYSNNINFNEEHNSRFLYTPDQEPLASLFFSSSSNNHSEGWNMRAGADYVVSPQTTLGVLITGNARSRLDRLAYTSNVLNSLHEPDSTTRGSTVDDYSTNTIGLNLNMQHRFDSSGKTLTADLDHIRYNTNGGQLSWNDNYLPNGSLHTSTGKILAQPSNVNIYSFKADYIHPLQGDARLEAGFKSSAVTNDNQANWLGWTGIGYAPDYDRTNHFVYKEQIQAAYVNASKEWKCWGIQTGLRWEATTATGHQLGNALVKDSSFTRRYSRLFPTIHLLYKLDSAANHTIVAGYGERIRRPSYQQLNPFLLYRDNYTWSAGNPALLPEYARYFDLRYNYKQYISITVSYGIEQSLNYPITQKDGNLFISRPQNFSSRHSWGIIPHLSWSPVKWWSCNIGAVIFFFTNYSHGSPVQLTKYTNMHEVEVFNQLQITSTWSAELSGFFPGRQSFGQNDTRAGYDISAGIQKKLLGNRVTIRAKMDDIFYTRKANGRLLNINQADHYFTKLPDTRRVAISFSYRFGKDANARKRNHNTGGAEAEEKRAY